MNTLNELAYSILENLNNFKVSTAERIPLELLYKKIADARATIAKNKLPKIDQALYQRVECLTAEDYQMQCDGFKSNTLIKLVRMPDTLSVLGKDIIYFGFDDFSASHRINIVTMESWLTYGFRRYTFNTPVGTKIPEGYMVAIPGNCNFKYFTSVIIQSDPMEGFGCSQLLPDDPYPMPQDWAIEVEIMIKKDILSTTGRQFPGDFKSNQSDDPVQEVSKPVNSTIP